MWQVDRRTRNFYKIHYAEQSTIAAEWQYQYCRLCCIFNKHVHTSADTVMRWHSVALVITSQHIWQHISTVCSHNFVNISDVLRFSFCYSCCFLELSRIIRICLWHSSQTSFFELSCLHTMHGVNIHHSLSILVTWNTDRNRNKYEILKRLK